MLLSPLTYSVTQNADAVLMSRVKIQWLKWPGQAWGSVDGVGNLAHFMHKRPLFHYQQGAQTGAGGLSPRPLTLITAKITNVIIKLSAKSLNPLNVPLISRQTKSSKYFQ